VLIAAGTDQPQFDRPTIDENSPNRDRVAKWLFQTFNAGVGATKAEVWAVIRERDRGAKGKPMGRTSFYEAWDKLEASEAIVWHDTEVGKRCMLSIAEASRIGLLSGNQSSTGEAHDDL
jgi:hypothetical protein